MVDDHAASIYRQVISSNYIDLASYTLLYYDYALTLPAEVERFWSMRSLSWASAFFYLNRYLSLLGHVPAIVQRFWESQSPDSAKICSSLALYHQYLIVIIQTIVAILLVIRTYALYDQNLRVLLFICVCGLVVITFGAWSVASGHGNSACIIDIIDLPITCVMCTDRHDATRLANAWIAMLLFDILIFSMTVFKSWSRGDMVHRSVHKLLLRDGAIYFGIIAVIELVTVITFFVSSEYQRGSTSTLTNVVSSTMISRLMLNLRDPQYSTKLSRPAFLLLTAPNCNAPPSAKSNSTSTMQNPPHLYHRGSEVSSIDVVVQMT